MSNTNQTQIIEAILFSLGKPLTPQELAKISSLTASEVEGALRALSIKEKSGIVLVNDGRTVELRVAPVVSPLIEKIKAEEYTRDIGKAGLETLAAILYKGPLSRSEIDFIRGVNSSQTLRTLVMRGLVRKVSHPHHQRSFLFEPTTELLAHMGITTLMELPQYEGVKQKLQQLQEAYEITRQSPVEA